MSSYPNGVDHCSQDQSLDCLDLIYRPQSYSRNIAERGLNQHTYAHIIPTLKNTKNMQLLNTRGSHRSQVFFNF